MGLVSGRWKGDGQDGKQQCREAKQTSHSCIPRMRSGSGVANPLGGTFSPLSAEKYKSCVIIASGAIATEVIVTRRVTHFSVSPKRVKTRISRHRFPGRFSLAKEAIRGPLPVSRAGFDGIVDFTQAGAGSRPRNLLRC